MKNHYNVYKIKDGVKLYNMNLSCEQLTSVFCAFKLYVSKNYFVNITLLSLKYSGPNVGYCKYGGLSIYDNVDNNMKEVLLLCDNISLVTFNTKPKQNIVSSTQHLFLIFYAYWPYSEIRPTIIVNPTRCNGVHILRYDFILVFVIIH